MSLLKKLKKFVDDKIETGVAYGMEHERQRKERKKQKEK